MKNLSTLALVLLSSVLPYVFASCSSDDDGSGEPKDAAYTMENVKNKLLPGIGFDGKDWLRLNEDGTTDECVFVYDPGVEDYETAYNIGTWTFSAGIDDSQAYHGTLRLKDKKTAATRTLQYRFVNKDKIEITDTDASKTSTWTRAKWPTWDNTGQALNSVPNEVAMIEGQWICSQELHELFQSSNALSFTFSSVLAKYTDEPLRLQISETPNQFFVLLHFGDISPKDEIYPSLKDYIGKWMAFYGGELRWYRTNKTNGLFNIVMPTISADYKLPVQYTHLGDKGVYISPRTENKTAETPDGWYFLKKATTPVEYEVFTFTL